MCETIRRFTASCFLFCFFLYLTEVVAVLGGRGLRDVPLSQGGLEVLQRRLQTLHGIKRVLVRPALATPLQIPVRVLVRHLHSWPLRVRIQCGHVITANRRIDLEVGETSEWEGSNCVQSDKGVLRDQ